MKIAVMQPYLFPYLGYFQLVAAVDTFVIFDDVNYIKKGWINRNRILLNGNEHLFTLSVVDASQNRLIRDVQVCLDMKQADQILELMRHAYAKAPEFARVYPLLEKVFRSQDASLLRILECSIREVAGYLGVTTKFILSSAIEKSPAAKGASKVIDVCKQLHADEYVNPIGGTQLYDAAVFGGQGIQLSFIKSKPVIYLQFGNDFVSGLSMIDVLMFNTREQVRTFLGEYELIGQERL